MLVDAALCQTQDKTIIQEIQQKYDINSLIEVLDTPNDSFHFLEIIVRLLRSIYLNLYFELPKVSETQITKIKEHIYNQLKKTTDLRNISQIRFATESITLLSNCIDIMSKGGRLQTAIGSLLSNLLQDFDVHAIPNAFDFAPGDAQKFLDYDFIDNHNDFVDNEWYERDVVVETHQKQLVAAILRLITKTRFKGLLFEETKFKSDLCTGLRINEQTIEKWIILLILKYADIPFDEDFTDLLFETLLHLQSKPDDSLLIEVKHRPTDQMLTELWSKAYSQARENDKKFTDFAKIVQNAIVSIHNCEITRSTQDLDDITKLIKNISQIQEDNDNSLEQNTDSRFAIILAELLYKIRCNSTLKEIRQNRTINELVVKVYKLLGYFMYNNQQICVRLWHFSHKLFCMKWWNDKLNRYHAEFFLSCVEGLGEYKTTLYTKELFAKVCKSIGHILINELQKEVVNQKDESISKLLTLITQIGEQYEHKTINENEEEIKENSKGKSKSEKENEENNENYEKSVEKLMEVIEDEEEVKNKISFNIPKSKLISEYLKNNFRNESVYKFTYHLIKVQNDQNKNEPQNNKCDSQTMNGFWLSLTKWKIVEVFKGLVRSISKDQDNRYDKRILFILNFIYKAIKYVTQRDQEYQNMKEYQYIMNMLLLTVKSKELMKNNDIKRMFSSEKAINSWFHIIRKDNDFNYISNHVRWIVYEILSEILRIDDQFARTKIMLWTYSIYKNDELLNRFDKLVQHFTDLVIHNEEQFSLICHESDQLSDYLEIHSYMKFLRSLCDNSKEFQDYLRVQHNRIKGTGILPAVTDLIRVFLAFTKYEVALRVWIDAFELVYALINQKVQENKELFMNSEICNYAKKILQIGWFSKDKYLLLNGKEWENKNNPFKSNKLILELKLKALQVINQIYDQKYKYQILISIGKQILDENLMMGYAHLMHLNNGSMHNKFFDKNDKANDNFSIQMLFEWYYLRAKTSDENEIEQKNIIQFYDNESTVDKFYRVASMSFFKIQNLFKNRSFNLSIKECNNHLKSNNFDKNAKNFLESCSSHIEILVSSSLKENVLKGDPFLNFVNNPPEIVNQEKTIVTKYLIIQPRFLLITQKQKTEFWSEFNSDDPKSFCKKLQKYGIEKNHEFSIMDKVQNSWYCLPDWVKRENWFEKLLVLLVFAINVLIFVGYKVDGTSGELRIFNSKTATDIIVYGIGSSIWTGYFYVILIRIIIIIGVTKSKYALQDPDQKTIKSKQRNLWKKLLNLFKVLMANIHNYDLWCLIPCFIFALTAISYRPYFFVFCIIVFLIYSNSLMEVVLALWIPKHRILWTLFLTMCVIYIYSVLSLALFRNDYSQNISNSWDTVFNCYVTIADQWYKNNGLGGFLSINAPAISLNNSFSVNWGRFSFDLIFFIVVPTLLINIIFSIIVDNFAERRAKRDQLRENQLSQCFVCGKLDNDIEDFIQHTKYMHNCWDYVYYIGYLNSTAYEDLVDYADVYVKKMIESNKFEWFPCYFRENSKDLSIASPIQGISSRLDTLEKNIIETKNSITEIKESNKETRKH